MALSSRMEAAAAANSVYEPSPSLFRKSATCQAWHHMLRNSNDKLFGMDADSVNDRLRELALQGDRLLGVQAALSTDGWRAVVMLQAPRLLTDPLWRTTLRLALLGGFAGLVNRKNYTISNAARRTDNSATSNNLAKSMLELEMICGGGDDLQYSPSSNVYLEEDDEVNLAMMKIAAKERAQKLERILQHDPVGGSPDNTSNAGQNILMDLLLNHGDVLMCPVSTYLRLFFLSASAAPFDSTNIANVRNVLKMNTNEFVDYLKNRNRNEWDRYARFIVDCIVAITRCRKEDAVHNWNREMEDVAVLELVDDLERRLCGALNDFGSCQDSSGNETLYSNLLDEIKAIKVSSDSAE